CGAWFETLWNRHLEARWSRSSPTSPRRSTSVTRRWTSFGERSATSPVRTRRSSHERRRHRARCHGGGVAPGGLESLLGGGAGSPGRFVVGFVAPTSHGHSSLRGLATCFHEASLRAGAVAADRAAAPQGAPGGCRRRARQIPDETGLPAACAAGVLHSF